MLSQSIKKVAVAAAWLSAKPAKLLKFVFYMQLICNKHINLTINNKKDTAACKIYQNYNFHF